MDQLRKAGKALQRFDDAYSNKIADFYTDRFEKSGKTGVDIAKSSIGLMLGGATPSTRKAGIEVTPGRDGKVNPMERQLANVLDVAMPIESAVVKYALPAVGVTMAGQALYDLTTMFGGTADRPEPNTLSM